MRADKLFAKHQFFKVNLSSMIESPEKKKKTTLALQIFLIFFITLLALHLRYNFATQTIPAKPAIRGDAQKFIIYAYNIVQDKTFSSVLNGGEKPIPDAYYTPLFPFIISLAIKALGKDLGDFVPAVILGQVLLGALLVPLVYLVGRLFLPWKWSLLAAALTALSPHLISFPFYILTENLFSFLQFLSLYLFILAVRSMKRYLFIASGVSYGLTYLTNPIIYFLPMIFFAFALYASYKTISANQRKKLTVNLVIFLLVFVSISGAWGIRNKVSLPEGSITGKDRAINNLIVGALPGYHNYYANKTGRAGVKKVIYEQEKSRPLYMFAQSLYNPGDKYRLKDSDAGLKETEIESNGSIVKCLGIILGWIKESPGRYLSYLWDA
jgi:4-amino-4-deoxy-L-arabinose transferase-like glycosyltransferase